MGQGGVVLDLSVMLNNSTRNNIKNTQKKASTVATERRDRLLQESVPFVLALITEASPISGTVNRWLYSWRQAKLVANAIHQFDYVTPEYWYMGTALNTIEAQNTALHVGPGIVKANIPAGFSVKPVEGYVLLFPGRRVDGTPMWLFSVPNAIDGACE